MHKLKGIQLSVDELKTLNDAHIIISEMHDAPTLRVWHV